MVMRLQPTLVTCRWAGSLSTPNCWTGASAAVCTAALLSPPTASWTSTWPKDTRSAYFFAGSAPRASDAADSSTIICSANTSFILIVQTAISCLKAGQTWKDTIAAATAERQRLWRVEMDRNQTMMEWRRHWKSTSWMGPLSVDKPTVAGASRLPAAFGSTSSFSMTFRKSATLSWKVSSRRC